jgi:ketosteroid isomerase-like protein
MKAIGHRSITFCNWHGNLSATAFIHKFFLNLLITNKFKIMETATMTALDTVKAMYDAFGKGDIPFILEHVSEKFTWQDPCNHSMVPYGGRFNGRSGMLQFFQQLGGSTDTTLWEVNEYVSEQNKVVAFGRHGITCKETGKSAISDFAMVWVFKNGEPVSGRSYYNNAETEKAFS